jgi:hypothetical protein
MHYTEIDNMKKTKRLIPYMIAGLLLSWPVLAQNVFYAAPEGSGSACSEAAPCSITGVRDKVRGLTASMTSDITVNLRGGIYTLDETLAFVPQDGGQNGHRIIYTAYQAELPVISGGRKITGWQVHDAQNNIYRAQVGTDLNTRQLFVNGRRAVRARGQSDPPGFTKTGSGYTTDNLEMQNWNNITDIEFVALSNWKCYRCGVASIQGNQITMDQLCWDNAQGHAGWPMNEPEWIENAYELLDEEGEWYLDRSQGTMYYMPLAGEGMTAVSAYAPVLETLVSGEGTADNPLQNITFRSLVFAHATWLLPSTEHGYPDVQACYMWTDGYNYTDKVIPNVEITFGHGLHFERNMFIHLGASSLALEKGCQYNYIVGNTFRDISGNGINIGNVTPNPGDSREQVRCNFVLNNYITKIAQEYSGGVAIFAGYTDSTVIEHNEIHDVNYSGVSVGWGWGATSYAKDNKVRYNLIYDHMLMHDDGGGVYTLSPQPGTEVAYNYIHHQIHRLGALYPDEGTKYTHWHHNVVHDVVRWLHVWTGSISDNTIEDNWHAPAEIENNGTNNTIQNNPEITDGNWPQEALEIMAAAGLEDEYLDIRDKTAEMLPVKRPDRMHKWKNQLILKESGLYIRVMEDNAIKLYDLRGKLLKRMAVF